MNITPDVYFLSHPDPMWVYDLKTLRFLAVNNAAVAKYGYSRDEFLAMMIADIRPEEDRHALHSNVAAAAEGPREGGVWRHLLKSGEMIYVDITGHTIDYGGRSAELIAARDVSDCVKSARTLERAKRILELAGSSAKFGAWSYDVATEHLEWSPQTARLHDEPDGFSPKILDGMFYFAPEHRDRIATLFQACIDHARPYDETLQIITAKGRRIWVRVSGEAECDRAGHIIAVYGSFQDITELTTAQREAGELDRRLAETLESIGDAVYMLDRDWRFTYLNGKAEEVLQRKRDDLIGRGVIDEFPEISGSVFEMEYKRSLDTGSTVRFEQAYAPLGGTFRVTAHPTPNGLAVYFSDVTEERRKTEQLRLLEAAVSQINDMIIITDATRHDSCIAETIVYVNGAFERVTGFAQDEAIGQDPRFLQGPKTKRSELDRIRQAVETRSPVRAELINYTKFGQEYWLELDIAPLADHSGTVTHFVAIMREITERRRAEEALRISETRFRLIAEISGTAAWDWDISEGRLWWSDGMFQQFGHHPDPDCKLPTAWRANVHPDDEKRVDEMMDKLLRGEIDAVVERYRFRRADGTWTQAEDRAFAIRDDEARAVRILGSMSDISQQLETERRLRQAQKLEAVGQLTGGVAHDFNNLLTIIIGNIEMIQESLDADDPLRQFADMSARAADRGADLTSRLLAFSRNQTLQTRVTNINEVIGGTEDMLRHTLNETIDIDIALTDDLWLTEIDIAQLESALLNLAINSRDAMPEGGSLTIESANAMLDDDYVSAEPDLVAGQYVMISVRDSGHGIAKDKISHVFEPFFTTKRVGMGTGLGLSMVYGFVKQTGGNIQIFSEPDVGTTVRLYFPRYLGGLAAHGVASEKSPLPLQVGTESILVVENDALILQQLMAQLTGLGYEVIAAQSGPPALDILRRRPQIDLLLTDVVLPGGMNGRQIAKAAQAISPSLKFLYTSGHLENAIVRGLRLDQGVNFLSKPYRRSELAGKIREAFDS